MSDRDDDLPFGLSRAPGRLPTHRLLLTIDYRLPTTDYRLMRYPASLPADPTVSVTTCAGVCASTQSSSSSGFRRSSAAGHILYRRRDHSPRPFLNESIKLAVPR